LEQGEQKGTEPVMMVTDSPSPRDARINIRGEVEQLGAEVPRGIPVVLAMGRSPKLVTEQSGRMHLANWIANSENPLTPRVVANRIWSHLFGRGIVESVDNFGSLGEEPSHPELLDYLAQRLIQLKWSQKKLIREIVLSNSYRLSSEHHAQNYVHDADGKYLWRMPRRRLEAEALRDSMLVISGQLEHKVPVEGSPVMELSTNDIIGRGKNNLPPLDISGRRSIYLPLLRNMTPETLAVFDMADASLPIAQREVTTVPTQALFLMNNTFVMSQCQRAARRLLQEVPSNDAERLTQLFLLCLNRLPTSTERANALRYFTEYATLISDKESTLEEIRLTAWSGLTQTLMATGEFRYIY
jgi:Protein of unknown function (DUF1553)